MSLSRTDERAGQDHRLPSGGLAPRDRPSTARPKEVPARRGPRWWRWLRRLLELAVMGGAAYALWHELTRFHNASGLFSHLRWPWLVAAAAAEAASMVAFARLQRWLLRAGGVDLDLGSMVEITFAGNALSVSLPGGAAWSAAWAYEQLRRRGADRTLAVWVLLVAGALSSYALFLLLVTGVWWAGDQGPAKDFRLPGLALACIPLAALALGLLARRSRAVRHQVVAVASWGERRLPGGPAAGRGLRSLAGRLRAVQPRPLDWMGTFGLALLNWVYDAGCLVLSMITLGIPVPWRGLLVAYGLAQVGASLPITPGGIGVVEGSLSFALIAYGVGGKQAVAAVLLYRIISFWALVPIGWGAWGWLELQSRDRRHPERHHPWAWHHGTPAHSR